MYDKINFILSNLNILNDLKSCRDEKEAKKYLLQNDISLSDDELYDLRNAYFNHTLNVDHLSIEQLEAIAGGVEARVIDTGIIFRVQRKKTSKSPGGHYEYHMFDMEGKRCPTTEDYSQQFSDATQVVDVKSKEELKSFKQLQTIEFGDNSEIIKFLQEQENEARTFRSLSEPPSVIEKTSGYSPTGHSANDRTPSSAASPTESFVGVPPVDLGISSATGDMSSRTPESPTITYHDSGKPASLIPVDPHSPPMDPTGHPDGVGTPHPTASSTESAIVPPPVDLGTSSATGDRSPRTPESSTITYHDSREPASFIPVDPHSSPMNPTGHSDGDSTPPPTASPTESFVGVPPVDLGNSSATGDMSPSNHPGVPPIPSHTPGSPTPVPQETRETTSSTSGTSLSSDQANKLDEFDALLSAPLFKDVEKLGQTSATSGIEPVTPPVQPPAGANIITKEEQPGTAPQNLVLPGSGEKPNPLDTVIKKLDRAFPNADASSAPQPGRTDQFGNLKPLPMGQTFSITLPDFVSIPNLRNFFSDPQIKTQLDPILNQRSFSPEFIAIINDLKLNAVGNSTVDGEHVTKDNIKGKIESLPPFEQAILKFIVDEGKKGTDYLKAIDAKGENLFLNELNKAKERLGKIKAEVTRLENLQPLTDVKVLSKCCEVVGCKDLKELLFADEDRIDNFKEILTKIRFIKSSVYRSKRVICDLFHDFSPEEKAGINDPDGANVNVNRFFSEIPKLITSQESASKVKTDILNERFNAFVNSGILSSLGATQFVEVFKAFAKTERSTLTEKTKRKLKENIEILPSPQEEQFLLRLVEADTAKVDFHNLFVEFKSASIQEDGFSFLFHEFCYKFNDETFLTMFKTDKQGYVKTLCSEKEKTIISLIADYKSSSNSATIDDVVIEEARRIVETLPAVKRLGSKAVVDRLKKTVEDRRKPTRADESQQKRTKSSKRNKGGDTPPPQQGAPIVGDEPAAAAAAAAAAEDSSAAEAVSGVNLLTYISQHATREEYKNCHNEAVMKLEMPADGDCGFHSLCFYLCFLKEHGGLINLDDEFVFTGGSEDRQTILNAFLKIWNTHKAEGIYQRLFSQLMMTSIGIPENPSEMFGATTQEARDDMGLFLTPFCDENASMELSSEQLNRLNSIIKNYVDYNKKNTHTRDTWADHPIFAIFVQHYNLKVNIIDGVYHPAANDHGEIKPYTSAANLSNNGTVETEYLPLRLVHTGVHFELLVINQDDPDRKFKDEDFFADNRKETILNWSPEKWLYEYCKQILDSHAARHAETPLSNQIDLQKMEDKTFKTTYERIIKLYPTDPKKVTTVQDEDAKKEIADGNKSIFEALVASESSIDPIVYCTDMAQRREALSKVFAKEVVNKVCETESHVNASGDRVSVIDVPAEGDCAAIDASLILHLLAKDGLIRLPNWYKFHGNAMDRVQTFLFINECWKQVKDAGKDENKKLFKELYFSAMKSGIDSINDPANGFSDEGKKTEKEKLALVFGYDNAKDLQDAYRTYTRYDEKTVYFLIEDKFIDAYIDYNMRTLSKHTYWNGIELFDFFAKFFGIKLRMVGDKSRVTCLNETGKELSKFPYMIHFKGGNHYQLLMLEGKKADITDRDFLEKGKGAVPKEDIEGKKKQYIELKKLLDSRKSGAAKAAAESAEIEEKLTKLEEELKEARVDVSSLTVLSEMPEGADIVDLSVPTATSAAAAAGDDEDLPDTSSFTTYEPIDFFDDTLLTLGLNRLRGSGISGEKDVKSDDIKKILEQYGVRLASDSERSGVLNLSEESYQLLDDIFMQQADKTYKGITPEELKDRVEKISSKAEKFFINWLLNMASRTEENATIFKLYDLEVQRHFKDDLALMLYNIRTLNDEGYAARLNDSKIRYEDLREVLLQPTFDQAVAVLKEIEKSKGIIVAAAVPVGEHVEKPIISFDEFTKTEVRQKTLCAILSAISGEEVQQIPAVARVNEIFNTLLIKNELNSPKCRQFVGDYMKLYMHNEGGKTIDEGGRPDYKLDLMRRFEVAIRYDEINDIEQMFLGQLLGISEDTAGSSKALERMRDRLKSALLNLGNEIIVDSEYGKHSKLFVDAIKDLASEEQVSQEAIAALTDPIEKRAIEGLNSLKMNEISEDRRQEVVYDALLLSQYSEFDVSRELNKKYHPSGPAEEFLKDTVDLLVPDALRNGDVYEALIKNDGCAFVTEVEQLQNLTDKAYWQTVSVELPRDLKEAEKGYACEDAAGDEVKPTVEPKARPLFENSASSECADRRNCLLARKEIIDLRFNEDKALHKLIFGKDAKVEDFFINWSEMVRATDEDFLDFYYCLKTILSAGDKALGLFSSDRDRDTDEFYKRFSCNLTDKQTLTIVRVAHHLATRDQMSPKKVANIAFNSGRAKEIAKFLGTDRGCLQGRITTLMNLPNVKPEAKELLKIMFTHEFNPNINQEQLIPLAKKLGCDQEASAVFLALRDGTIGKCQIEVASLLHSFFTDEIPEIDKLAISNIANIVFTDDVINNLADRFSGNNKISDENFRIALRLICEGKYFTDGYRRVVASFNGEYKTSIEYILNQIANTMYLGRFNVDVVERLRHIVRNQTRQLDIFWMPDSPIEALIKNNLLTADSFYTPGYEHITDMPETCHAAECLKFIDDGANLPQAINGQEGSVEIGTHKEIDTFGEENQILVLDHEQINIFTFLNFALHVRAIRTNEDCGTLFYGDARDRLAFMELIESQIPKDKEFTEEEKGRYYEAIRQSHIASRNMSKQVDSREPKEIIEGSLKEAFGFKNNEGKVVYRLPKENEINQEIVKKWLAYMKTKFVATYDCYMLFSSLLKLLPEGGSFEVCGVKTIPEKKLLPGQHNSHDELDENWQQADIIHANNKIILRIPDSFIYNWQRADARRITSDFEKRLIRNRSIESQLKTFVTTSQTLLPSESEVNKLGTKKKIALDAAELIEKIIKSRCEVVEPSERKMEQDYLGYMKKGKEALSDSKANDEEIDKFLFNSFVRLELVLRARGLYNTATEGLILELMRVCEIDTPRKQFDVLYDRFDKLYKNFLRMRLDENLVKQIKQFKNSVEEHVKKLKDKRGHGEPTLLQTYREETFEFMETCQGLSGAIHSFEELRVNIKILRYVTFQKQDKITREPQGLLSIEKEMLAIGNMFRLVKYLDIKQEKEFKDFEGKQNLLKVLIGSLPELDNLPDEQVWELDTEAKNLLSELKEKLISVLKRRNLYTDYAKKFIDDFNAEFLTSDTEEAKAIIEVNALIKQVESQWKLVSKKLGLSNNKLITKVNASENKRKYKKELEELQAELDKVIENQGLNLQAQSTSLLVAADKLDDATKKSSSQVAERQSGSYRPAFLDLLTKLTSESSAETVIRKYNIEVEKAKREVSTFKSKVEKAKKARDKAKTRVEEAQDKVLTTTDELKNQEKAYKDSMKAARKFNLEEDLKTARWLEAGVIAKRSRAEKAKMQLEQAKAQLEQAEAQLDYGKAVLSLKNEQLKFQLERTKVEFASSEGSGLLSEFRSKSGKDFTQTHANLEIAKIRVKECEFKLEAAEFKTAREAAQEAVRTACAEANEATDKASATVKSTSNQSEFDKAVEAAEEAAQKYLDVSKNADIELGRIEANIAIAEANAARAEADILAIEADKAVAKADKATKAAEAAEADRLAIKADKVVAEADKAIVKATKAAEAAEAAEAAALEAMQKLAQAEFDRAQAEFDRAQAEFDRAQAEFDRAQAEFEKIDSEEAAIFNGLDYDPEKAKEAKEVKEKAMAQMKEAESELAIARYRLNICSSIVEDKHVIDDVGAIDGEEEPYKLKDVVKEFNEVDRSKPLLKATCVKTPKEVEDKMNLFAGVTGTKTEISEVVDSSNGTVSTATLQKDSDSEIEYIPLSEFGAKPNSKVAESHGTSALSKVAAWVKDNKVKSSVFIGGVFFMAILGTIVGCLCSSSSSTVHNSDNQGNSDTPDDPPKPTPPTPGPGPKPGPGKKKDPVNNSKDDISDDDQTKLQNSLK